jgi:hypothetical protein
MSAADETAEGLVINPPIPNLSVSTAARSVDSKTSRVPSFVVMEGPPPA